MTIDVLFFHRGNALSYISLLSVTGCVTLLTRQLYVRRSVDVIMTSTFVSGPTAHR